MAILVLWPPAFSLAFWRGRKCGFHFSDYTAIVKKKGAIATAAVSTAGRSFIEPDDRR
ncbi:MAG: hypothetical protein ACRECW_18020 [Phyllobacterium sp.]